ncbi:hypothetical protein SDC9_103702 [bioreactor metagenome]|uniref:Type II secretion system protein GspF domain-containing protein n=1 Tax=bioreactor metagenome TaxID=1076179 RepID=A0A645AUF7_9ZZZZ
MLRQAGIRAEITEFNTIKLFFIGIVFILTMLFSLIFFQEPNFRLLAILVGLLIAVMAPTLYVRQRTTARKNSIQKQLPEVMDILMVSVEAGLGLDESIMRISEKMSGPLIDEFLLLCREIQMGKQRKKAYQDFGECADVQELKTFASAIIQAEQLGIPIKNVLKTQSLSMRTARKQRAQEKGMKAPVKMIIPMVMFILPVLFIILLAPVAIQLMEEFT